MFSFFLSLSLSLSLKHSLCLSLSLTLILSLPGQYLAVLLSLRFTPNTAKERQTRLKCRYSPIWVLHCILFSFISFYPIAPLFQSLVFPLALVSPISLMYSAAFCFPSNCTSVLSQRLSSLSSLSPSSCRLLAVLKSEQMYHVSSILYGAPHIPKACAVSGILRRRTKKRINS